MKNSRECCIVTVYNSQNCGSFLQAYALGKAAADLGYEVSYYKIHNKENTRMIKTALKSLLKCNFRAFRISLQQPIKFKQSVNLLTETRSTDIPVYILGSDTIWDLHISRFKKKYKVFWGILFQNSKVVSYAPSIGFSKESDFENVTWIKEALDRLSGVSVRENRAKEILQRFTKHQISVVCDPTILLNAEHFDQLAPKPGIDCIVLYYYGKMPDAYKNCIMQIAKKVGIKIVSFGSANSWCDVIEPYDPIRFLSLYRDARYIITNTFHGTVFAHIYHKKFAVIKNNRPKVADFLEKMGTLDKMVEKPSDVEEVLNSVFDYTEIDQRISKERENGIQYLMENLKD